MTELQLYKFIEENDISYNTEENPFGGQKDIYIFIPIYLLGEFIDLFKGSLILINSPLECHLKEDCLCVEMTEVCEYFDIEPENIFKKK